MPKILNNDQRLKKAIKDVQALGLTGSTFLVIELCEAIDTRLKALKEHEGHYTPFYSAKTAIQVLETFKAPLQD